MSRSKLKKFEEITNLENVIEPTKAVYNSIAGNWNNLFFKNSNPIVLELGCGHGEYSLGLSQIFPGKNFIGVDIKGERLWKAATGSITLNLKNVAFLRAQIQDLEKYFSIGEISEIWITFPDPHPRDKEAKKRLTGLRFLEIYKKILTPNGIVHLKTDNLEIFNYTLEVLNSLNIKVENQTDDLYQSDLQNFTFNLQTGYEKKFLPIVKTIKYLNFKFN